MLWGAAFAVTNGSPFLRRLLGNERGQGAGEYALIAALVSVVAVGTLIFFGDILGASVGNSAGAAGSARAVQLP